MAPKTQKQSLIRVLESLGKNCFKKFRQTLVDRKEEPRVSRRAVEDADEMDVADVLVRTFTEKKALEVAIEILKDIDCHEEAQELDKILKSETKLAGAGVTAATVSKSYMVGDQHFVDFHRKAIIQRVRTVAPIFDDLLDKKVLRQEAYEDLKAEPTPQKKMRALYDNALTGPKVKDIFYDVLEQNEEFLMEDLKGE